MENVKEIITTLHIYFFFTFFSHKIVASSPDSKSKTENLTGATSGEHELKSVLNEKGQDTEAQRSQVSPSASQQPSTPTLNGLISSEFVWTLSNFQFGVSHECQLRIFLACCWCC